MLEAKEVPILCLASWYPNELDAFEGDFIKRKMQAISLYRPVHVLHVKKHKQASFNKEKTETQEANLKTSIYYKKQMGNGLFHSFKNYISFLKTHNTFLKKHIVQYGKPKVILVQVPYNAGVIAWYWKKRYNINYILTEHYGIYNERYEQHFNTRSWLYKYVVKSIVKNAIRLITVSNSLAENMSSWVIKREHTRISNVVETNIFSFKEKPAAQPFVFCHLSSMIPVKNIPGMIEAAYLLSQKRQDFIFNLIGGQNDSHIKLAEKLGIKDNFVFFKKAVSYERVASTLQASHALLMFSHTESQSCISLEALCTGTPVISSNAGGIEEHLTKENSIIVTRGNVTELAKAMNDIIDNYNNYQLEKIANSNQALWNYKEIGRQYNQLIENVWSQ